MVKAATTKGGGVKNSTGVTQRPLCDLEQLFGLKVAAHLEFIFFN